MKQFFPSWTTSKASSSGWIHVVGFLLSIMMTSHTSKAFVTVVVELDPSYTAKPPACNSTFIKYFESNLTAWVVNATRSMAFLSDFTVPGGFNLTYFNNSTRSRSRRLGEQQHRQQQSQQQPPQQHPQRRQQQRSLGPTSCTKCTSASCSLSCGIGVCNLCAGSRRLTEAAEEGKVAEKEGDNKVTMEITGSSRKLDIAHSRMNSDNNKDLVVGDNDEQRRMVTANWVTVGSDVTRLVKPSVIFYASMHSGGCLGNTNLLSVNATFLSNIVIDAVMNLAIVRAFGSPAPVPVNSPTACCSINFKDCITYCGTTQAQCLACPDRIVGWMAQGPPAVGSCSMRWGDCSYNQYACCPGLQCIGDNLWKGCFYIPP